MPVEDYMDPEDYAVPSPKAPTAGVPAPAPKDTGFTEQDVAKGVWQAAGDAWDFVKPVANPLLSAVGYGLGMLGRPMKTLVLGGLENAKKEKEAGGSALLGYQKAGLSPSFWGRAIKSILIPPTDQELTGTAVREKLADVTGIPFHFKEGDRAGHILQEDSWLPSPAGIAHTAGAVGNFVTDLGFDVATDPATLAGSGLTKVGAKLVAEGATAFKALSLVNNQAARADIIAGFSKTFTKLTGKTLDLAEAEARLVRGGGAASFAEALRTGEKGIGMVTGKGHVAAIPGLGKLVATPSEKVSKVLSIAQDLGDTFIAPLVPRTYGIGKAVVKAFLPAHNVPGLKLLDDFGQVADPLVKPAMDKAIEAKLAAAGLDRDHLEQVVSFMEKEADPRHIEKVADVLAEGKGLGINKDAEVMSRFQARHGTTKDLAQKLIDEGMRPEDVEKIQMVANKSREALRLAKEAEMSAGVGPEDFGSATLTILKGHVDELRSWTKEILGYGEKEIGEKPIVDFLRDNVLGVPGAQNEKTLELVKQRLNQLERHINNASQVPGYVPLRIGHSPQVLEVLLDYEKSAPNAMRHMADAFGSIQTMEEANAAIQAHGVAALAGRSVKGTLSYGDMVKAMRDGWGTGKGLSRVQTELREAAKKGGKMFTNSPAAFLESRLEDSYKKVSRALREQEIRNVFGEQMPQELAELMNHKDNIQKALALAETDQRRALRLLDGLGLRHANLLARARSSAEASAELGWRRMENLAEQAGKQADLADEARVGVERARGQGEYLAPMTQEKGFDVPPTPPGAGGWGANEVPAGGLYAENLRLGKAQGAEEIARANLNIAARGARVPTMITREMDQKLTELGYTYKEINAMKPAEAWEKLGNKPGGEFIGQGAGVGEGGLAARTGERQSAERALANSEENLSNLEQLAKGAERSAKAGVQEYKQSVKDAAKLTKQAGKATEKEHSLKAVDAFEEYRQKLIEVDTELAGWHPKDGYTRASTVLANIPEGQDFLLPAEVAEAYQRSKELTRDPRFAAGFLSSWRALNREWKIATLANPGSLMRDQMGNFFAHVQGGAVNILDPKDLIQHKDNLVTGWKVALAANASGAEAQKALRGIKIIIEGSGPNAVTMDMKQLLDKAHSAGLIDSGLGRAELQGLGDKFNVAPRLWTVDMYKKLAHFGTEVKSINENANKISFVLGRMQKGDSFDHAVLMAQKFMFNFRNVSTAIAIARRYGVAPFIAWQAKSIPLQAEMMIKRPGYMLAAMKIKDAVEGNLAGVDPRENKEYVRQIMRKTGVRVRKNKDGSWEVWSTDGVIPLSDIVGAAEAFGGDENAEREWLNGMVGGPIQALHSLFTGRDLRSGRDLRKMDALDLPLLNKLPTKGYVVDAIRKLGTRPLQVAEQMYRMYRGDKDPDTGETRTVDKAGAIMSFFSPVRLSTEGSLADRVRAVGRLKKEIRDLNYVIANDRKLGRTSVAEANTKEKQKLLDKLRALATGPGRGRTSYVP